MLSFRNVLTDFMENRLNCRARWDGARAESGRFQPGLGGTPKDSGVPARKVVDGLGFQFGVSGAWRREMPAAPSPELTPVPTE